MKQLLFLAVVCVLIGLGTGCKKIKGKGDIVNENRTVTNYSGISLSVPATVYYRQDSVYKLSVTAQENLMAYIETYTDGGELVITFKDGYSLGSHDPITLTVTAPSVGELDVSGSGDINVSGPWNPSDVKLNISGSGNISADTVSTENIRAIISGSGNISINKGIASGSSLNISGSGTMRTEGVAVGIVTATISGSGDIYCWAVAQLNATISGSGNVYYNGSPEVNTQISGSGTVRHL